MPEQKPALDYADPQTPGTQHPDYARRLVELATILFIGVPVGAFVLFVLSCLVAWGLSTVFDVL